MGGGEGNPLMEMLIRANDMLFLMQKCLVVGLWLVILVIHKNFRIARMGLWGAFILYTGILLYHFVLQTTEPPPQHPLDSMQQSQLNSEASPIDRWKASGRFETVENPLDLG
jgi:hypothetical protein